jgi:hypothetical protein
MRNENCLAGIQCPQCGNEHRLLITATVVADVTDGGADIADGSDMHWDDASMTRCPDCDKDGPLVAFRVHTKEKAAPAEPLATVRDVLPVLLAMYPDFEDTESYLLLKAVAEGRSA